MTKITGTVLEDLSTFMVISLHSF